MIESANKGCGYDTRLKNANSSLAKSTRALCSEMAARFGEVGKGTEEVYSGVLIVQRGVPAVLHLHRRSGVEAYKVSMVTTMNYSIIDSQS